MLTKLLSNFIPGIRCMLILCFVTLTFQSLAKDIPSDSIKAAIHEWRLHVFNEKVESARVAKNDTLRFYIEMFLNTPNTFNDKLDQIPFFGDLHSPDQQFRLLTWNVPIGDGEFGYYCFLQKADGSWVEFTDGQHYGRKLENKTFKYDNWLGALYYEIVPAGNKKDQYYFLLGWDGRTKMSNRKIMEVLHFDKKGTPRFGKSILKQGEFKKRRLILEYTEDAYASLRYHPKKEMIVFSHLEPLRPELEGVYEFYAPDLSFDAYVKKGKYWVYKPDVDVRSEKNDKPYTDPRKAPSPKPRTQ